MSRADYESLYISYYISLPFYCYETEEQKQLSITHIVLCLVKFTLPNFSKNFIMFSFTNTYDAYEL